MDRSNRRNRRAYTLLEISQNYLKVTSSSLGHISLYDIAIAVLENHPFPYSSGAESRLPVSESAKNPLFTFIVPTFPTLRLVKERKKKKMKKKEREDPRRVGYFVRFEVESILLEKERERKKSNVFFLFLVPPEKEKKNSR